MMQLRSVDCNGTDSGGAAAPAPKAMGARGASQL